MQRVQAKRKVTFQGGPPAVTASKRALEHKVSMAKKKNTGGAPPQAKRTSARVIAKNLYAPRYAEHPHRNDNARHEGQHGRRGFCTRMGSDRARAPAWAAAAMEEQAA